MSGAAVTFARSGDAAQPSPSLWFDCPGERLIDEGNGFFFHEEFLGGVVAAATTAATPLSPHFTFSGDTDTVTSKKSAEIGGYLDMETDGDDNDAGALVTQPFANITVDSGRRVWFEARLELGAIADQGIFVGLVEETGLTHDVVADGAAALVGESLIGFQILTDDQDAVDAVAKLDAGTAIEMAAIANGSTPLTADTEFKVGFRFDGQRTIQVFFNGAKVASYQITASTFPNAVNMGVVFAIKTGSAAAVSAAIDWIRAGAQVRA